ncbi:hypothetical protein Drorol1_Dr00002540 [Drosera rotundifolia]
MNRHQVSKTLENPLGMKPSRQNHTPKPTRNETLSPKLNETHDRVGRDDGATGEVGERPRRGWAEREPKRERLKEAEGYEYEGKGRVCKDDDMAYCSEAEAAGASASKPDLNSRGLGMMFEPRV